MSENQEKFEKKLKRYITAMNNEQPDMIPIRPFVAEFTGKYAGYSCQEITHDYNKAFQAVLQCANDFDWDAMVGNMVYVWTGLTQALGLEYYAIPGVEIGPDVAFQYKEPSEEKAFMKADEYDRLIADPTKYLYEIWLPRVSSEINNDNSFHSQIALVKGSMSMLSYFNDLGEQNAKMEEAGVVPAIAGILKAPLDILGDKLRGYIGLANDLLERPQKVLEACQALMPHLFEIALAGADSEHNVPVALWMHRGCVPFISFEHFEKIYWATLKPIVMELWAHNHQTLFYAEGNWDFHLDSFAELPEKSIVYHVDQGDIFKVKQKIGDRFCLSGGFPNYLLTLGTPEKIKSWCEKIIDEVAPGGGYIFDSGAIIQNDASVENIKIMTDFVREYGVYGKSNSRGVSCIDYDENIKPGDFINIENSHPRPGVCLPWSEKKEEIPEIKGDEKILQETWQELEGLAHMFIWHCLVSF